MIENNTAPWMPNSAEINREDTRTGYYYIVLQPRDGAKKYGKLVEIITRFRFLVA